MRKALASVVLAGAIVLGATACDGQGGGYNDNGDVAEVVYGHTVNGSWVEYGTPEIVYVSPAYYSSHLYLYRNPLHVHYTVPRGVTIGKSRSYGSGSGTVRSGSGSTRGTRSSIGGTTRTTRTTTTVGGSRSGRR